MSNSRRKFLRLATLATAFATIPVGKIFAQSRKEPPGHEAKLVEQDDPLANYSKASFRTYLNSIFQLYAAGGIIDVALVQVSDMPSTKGGECFTLLFRGGAHRQPQGTYALAHPSLGTFRLFIAPIGSDQNGVQGYLATINRLSYADTAAMSSPSEKP